MAGPGGGTATGGGDRPDDGVAAARWGAGPQPGDSDGSSGSSRSSHTLRACLVMYVLHLILTTTLQGVGSSSLLTDEDIKAQITRKLGKGRA